MLRQSLSILKQLGSTAKSQDATELLHEDLVMVEQRVEPTRKAAHMLHKKLQGCMQSQTGLDAEKRMKKLPLMLLSISMAESLKDFDGQSPIRRVLEMCCFIEKMLAIQLAEFEMNMEKEVLEPLNKLSEDDLPEILKNKKLFVKLNTDWNNARIRSQTSTAPQAKQDGLREEVEEAWRKLEGIKDQYSADLYHFATKEDDYANYFIRLLELQAEHHKNSHDFLDKTINELKENHNQKGPQLNLSSQKVYGEPLTSHLFNSDREIAAPIQECIHMLLKTGMREEGLFRLAAAASVVKKLKTCLDQGTLDHSEFSMDPHAVAGALKCYLRELPEPLMTFELYNDWFKAAGEKDLTQKLEQFRTLLKKLPPENYNNLRYLVQFLSLLSEQQAVNKMTPSNIAIVLGPNLLWPRVEGEIALMDMASASSVQVVTIIEPLIQNSSSLFSEAVSFEIPEPPSDQEVPPPGDLSQSVIPEKGKVSRTVSSSSTSSTGSIYHLPLSKSSSCASQDGTSLVKSGSFGRSSTTTWASPAPETPAVAPQQNPTNSSSPSPSPDPGSTLGLPSGTCASAANQQPTPAPRAVTQAGPNQTKSPTRMQSSDQLEPILEGAPDSPRAFVKMALPYKPKRCFNANKANHANESVTIHYTKPKAPPPPPQQPAPPPSRPPTNSQTPATAPPPAPTPAPGVKKPPAKKPGLKAPNCPPPLPPPSHGAVR